MVNHLQNNQEKNFRNHLEVLKMINEVQEKFKEHKNEQKLIQEAFDEKLNLVLSVLNNIDLPMKKIEKILLDPEEQMEEKKEEG